MTATTCGDEAVAPFISFVITTYRRAGVLDACLASVLALPDADIEVVVNDNNSPDETPAVVARHAGDLRLRYHRQAENIGFPRNILHALRRSRGRWCFILTDDDQLRPAAIPALRAALQLHPDAGFVFSPVVSVRDSDGAVVGCAGPASTDRVLPPGPRSAAVAGHWAYILTRQVLRRQAIDFVFYERAVTNAYFPCMVAAGLALEHPVVYLATPMAWHRVDNIQHWDEFGKNWREVYFRTHMDLQDCLRLVFVEKNVAAPDLVLAWQRKGLTDYARLPLAIGPLGLAVQRGFGPAMAAFARRIPLACRGWLTVQLGVSVLRWIVGGLGRARRQLPLIRRRSHAAARR